MSLIPMPHIDLRPDSSSGLLGPRSVGIIRIFLIDGSKPFFAERTGILSARPAMNAVEAELMAAANNTSGGHRIHADWTMLSR